MATANTARRWSVRGLARLLLIGLVLTYAGAASVWSAPPPKVADVLMFKPRQDGVTSFLQSRGIELPFGARRVTNQIIEH